MNVAIFSPPPSACWVDKLGWVADGFRQAGHEVRRCHALADVQKADAECDLLLFDQNAAGLHTVDLARIVERRPKRGSTRVLWQRDLVAHDNGTPLGDQSTLRTHSRLWKALDLVLVKERSLLDEYASLGINARWLDQACPANMPACTHPERPEWDVLVFGCTDYDQRRADVRALVNSGFRVLWLANHATFPLPPGVESQPWTHPLELSKIASRCGIVLGVDWRSDLPGYTSDRTYLAAGMGACYVARCTDYGADSAPCSPAAKVAAWVYDDAEQLIRIVAHALANREERAMHGMASRGLVMSAHTYRHRADEICHMVEELRGERLCAAAGASA